MNNNYYQSDIKTSRQEDGIYAIKYASQQMLIDKLQQKLEAYKNVIKEANKWVKDNVYFDYYGMPVMPNNSKVKELIDILNKVSGSDE